jgi:hypothetical protein
MIRHNHHSRRSLYAAAVGVLLLAVASGCKPVVKPLVAMSGKMATQGTFILGCGSINGEAVYVYAYRKADGGLHMMTTPARLCFVYEDATVDTARVDYNRWAWDNIRTRLHVPPGTFSTGYDVGLLRPEAEGER